MKGADTITSCINYHKIHTRPNIPANENFYFRRSFSQMMLILISKDQIQTAILRKQRRFL